MFWRPEIDPENEPSKVLLHKGSLTDSSRKDREVPYKIYYPLQETPQKLPFIVWSHGLGGSRDGAGFLGRFIASNGYIVINVQHPGTDTSIWEGKPGHPWDVIRNTTISRSASLDRFYDVPFVMDNISEIINDKQELTQMVDTNNAGISGHSFGALTTQIMAGQLFPDKNNDLITIKESRFKAGILYSFVPMGHLSDKSPEDLFGKMELPLLFMTGTSDDNPLTGQSYEYRMPVYEHTGSQEKHLLVLEDGDHMVFAGSRGQLSVNPKRQIHEQIIKIMSLAYWDYQLKGDEGAKEWLHSNKVTDWLSSEGKFLID